MLSQAHEDRRRKKRRRKKGTRIGYFIINRLIYNCTRVLNVVLHMYRTVCIEYRRIGIKASVYNTVYSEMCSERRVGCVKIIHSKNVYNRDRIEVALRPWQLRQVACFFFNKNLQSIFSFFISPSFHFAFFEQSFCINTLCSCAMPSDHIRH